MYPPVFCHCPSLYPMVSIKNVSNHFCRSIGHVGHMVATLCLREVPKVLSWCVRERNCTPQDMLHLKAPSFVKLNTHLTQSADTLITILPLDNQLTHSMLPSQTQCSPHTLNTPFTHSILTSHTQCSPHTLNAHLTHSILTSHTQYSPHTLNTPLRHSAHTAAHVLIMYLVFLLHSESVCTEITKHELHYRFELWLTSELLSEYETLARRGQIIMGTQSERIQLFTVSYSESEQLLTESRKR